MKSAGLFVLKSVVFIVIFWSLWIFIFRPLSSSLSSVSSTDAQSSQDDQNQKLVAKYWEQAGTTDKLLRESAAQQERMGAVITKQEEILRRQERVIQKWELQTGVTK